MDLATDNGTTAPSHGLTGPVPGPGPDAVDATTAGPWPSILTLRRAAGPGLFKFECKGPGEPRLGGLAAVVGRGRGGR